MFHASDDSASAGASRIRTASSARSVGNMRYADGPTVEVEVHDRRTAGARVGAGERHRPAGAVLRGVPGGRVARRRDGSGDRRAVPRHATSTRRSASGRRRRVVVAFEPERVVRVGGRRSGQPVGVVALRARRRRRRDDAPPELRSARARPGSRTRSSNVRTRRSASSSAVRTSTARTCSATVDGIKALAERG